MARPTTAERGREVRRKLLDVACRLIAERGWTAVSTRMLADRAGVTPGLVHYHFSSVQALLSEAATSAMRDYLDQAPGLFDQAESPSRGLELLLGELDRHTGLDPQSLLFVEAYLAATRDDALRGEISAVLAEFRSRLADWLGRCGVADPDATAAVLAAAIDGVLMHRALSPGLRGSDIAPVLSRIFAPAAGERGQHETEGTGDPE
ncbi:TetR/AcrR family transcriptional regulator [Streptomonospora wellingtoniae]|uniref:TetR/AcrR family transcriptional regulator n=1 Tax=Streptomonospora wellingtoniae TaxID=3075544 RepID=A0ABU2KVN9_9ACTN|nr:TetR/AcrR family transcriptional regulator [Streptomonospora sp. DSM 45055]MDT0303366.1 TetR/AcrR family transcriptional regulator [Streptomonospora sp. DSM 45055]